MVTIPPLADGGTCSPDHTILVFACRFGIAVQLPTATPAEWRCAHVMQLIVTTPKTRKFGRNIGAQSSPGFCCRNVTNAEWNPLALRRLISDFPGTCAHLCCRSGIQLLVSTRCDGAIIGANCCPNNCGRKSSQPKRKPERRCGCSGSNFGRALIGADYSTFSSFSSTVSIKLYSLASSAVMKLSRSVSCSIFSSVCPVCVSRIWFMRCLMRSTSL